MAQGKNQQWPLTTLASNIKTNYFKMNVTEGTAIHQYCINIVIHRKFSLLWF